MIDTLHCRQYASDKAAPIRLNAGFRSDLAWWRAFASEWNGVSFLPNPVHLPAVEMASDASGVVEVGTGTQLAWDQRSQPLPIASKELIPIILGCAAWGHSWQARRVICHCDNHVVVAAMRTRTSRDKVLMHLIRCLWKRTSNATCPQCTLMHTPTTWQMTCPGIICLPFSQRFPMPRAVQ